jgi:hypothetical protein
MQHDLLAVCIYIAFNRCQLCPLAIPTVCSTVSTVSTTNGILFQHSFVKVENYFKFSNYLLCNGDLAGLHNTVAVLCCEYVDGDEHSAISCDRSDTSCER